MAPDGSYDDGLVTLWTKDDVPPARKLDFGGWTPPVWQCIMWGILPVGTSLLSIVVLLLLPDSRRAAVPLTFPAAASTGSRSAGGEVMKLILPILLWFSPPC